MVTTFSRRPCMRSTYCRRANASSARRELAADAAAMCWKRFWPMAETAEKALCVREVLVMFTSAVKAEMWGPHSV